MNETYVTLQGWVGSAVDERDANGVPVASFRVGCTPRYYKNGGWMNGQTSWYTVNCWRSLARNVAQSVHTGDAVVVHGRVRVDVWEREDNSTSVRWIVDANWVGHDLTRGTTSFSKTVKPAQDPRESEEMRQLVHSYDDEGPQLDDLGEEVTTPAA